MHAAGHLQLQTNPFTANASGARIGRPLQAALGEVIRQIGLEAPVVVVCGNAGTGKTLLINMIARACTDMGLCARQIDRGDLMHVAFGQCADVLLIDEADSIPESTLHTLISPGANTSTTTMVFLCLPSNVRRFTSSGGRAVIIELAPLTHADARNYLLERATSAGRPDLFEADALDLLIDGSHGSPRVLRSIASLAFFAAVVDCSPRIGAKHVADALASQIHCEPPKSRQVSIPIAPRGEIPIATPIAPAPIKTPTIVQAFASPALSESAPAEPASDPQLSDPPPFAPDLAGFRKRFSGARPRSAVWIPRVVGVAAALVASVAIAEGLPSLLFSSIPSNANASNRPPVDVLVVPRLGFASVVPAPPAVPPRETPSNAEAAKQTADIAKALKDAAAKEPKSVASVVPARKGAAEQAQTSKKPAAKDSRDADQTKAANEVAYLKNAQAIKEETARAVPSVASKGPAAPPASLQELANPTPAQKEVATITQVPKQEEAPQAPAPELLAVLPPAGKQKEEDDRAWAEEIALAKAREAVLAKVSADRALAAKQAEERQWAARQAANREGRRILSNSLRGINR
jgi:hypothetical protein